MTKRHRLNSKGNLAEFAPACGILILALFPLIDFLGLAMSVGTAYFISSQAAQKASVAGTPANAVDAMFDELDSLGQSNFSKFANLNIVMSKPTNLYVIRTDITSTGKGANGTEYTLAPPPDQFDPNSYIYEYCALTSFQINPFINLQAIPGISSIPGLGQPFNLRVTSTRAIESTEQFDLAQTPSWGTVKKIGFGFIPSPGGMVNSWRPGLPH